MSEILPPTVGDLFDLHATGDAFADPPHGETWTIDADGLTRTFDTISGPAGTPRGDGNPFTLALAPIDGPDHGREPLTVGAATADRVTVRRSALCPWCEGSGIDAGMSAPRAGDTCPVCGGSGRDFTDTKHADYIVSAGGRDLAAGPTMKAAEATCAAIGHAPADTGTITRPATAADLDALDLPPSALGIPRGGSPWWRIPVRPEAPSGDRGSS